MSLVPTQPTRIFTPRPIPPENDLGYLTQDRLYALLEGIGWTLEQVRDFLAAQAEAPAAARSRATEVPTAPPILMRPPRPMTVIPDANATIDEAVSSPEVGPPPYAVALSTFPVPILRLPRVPGQPVRVGTEEPLIGGGESSYQVPAHGLVLVSVCLDSTGTETEMQITHDGGVSWVYFNEKNPLFLEAGYTFSEIVFAGDMVDFQFLAATQIRNLRAVWVATT